MSKKALAISSFVVSLILDAFALQELLGTGFARTHASAAAVLLHAAALAFAGFAFWRWLPASYGKSRPTFVALLTGFCVPVPLLGQAAIATFRRVLDQKVQEDPEQHYIIANREALTMHESFEEVVNNPKSIPEILHGRDPKTRRNAVLALRCVEVRRAIPVLQKAIQDSDEQVRLLAQAQFNKIIAALEVGIKEIEAELHSGPRSCTTLIRLSELYHELVYLGLSSDESMRLYLGRSADLLEEALKLTPEDLNISVSLLRCYVKLGNTAPAHDRLTFLRSKNYRRELMGPWESDLFYQDRDWPALVESLRALRPSQGRMTILDDQIKLWVGDNPRARTRRKASAVALRRLTLLLGANADSPPSASAKNAPASAA